MDQRALLVRLMQGPVSGDVLARAGGQTRAAVWKNIEALREAGVAIHARPGRGYALAQPLDLLNSQVIAAGLPTDALARVASLQVAWTVDSTNSELLRRGQPAPGRPPTKLPATKIIPWPGTAATFETAIFETAMPETGDAATVLLAEQQTAGRGRRGREWASPLAAHLYLSLARSFAGGLGRLGGLSLVAGIATAEALHALGFDRIRLKWPNDLVVAGDGLQKLGGLLVEGGGEHAGPVRAVVGLGLNVRMPAGYAATERIDQPWSDLARLSPNTSPPSRNVLACAVLTHWLPALEAFDSGGLAPFLPRYAALDALAMQPVAIHAGGTVLTGTALGLADDGGLRVRMDNGDEQCVHAGEISVRSHSGRSA